MAYYFLVGGKILYDSLFANLPVPHITTIYKEIHQNAASLIEGVCRVTDLKTFLEARNLPLSVWLSEDATRISNRIQYDHKSNQLVGFVSPFDEKGMPAAFSFSATSAKAIENFFLNYTPASSLYTVMAQPIQDDAPAFCFMLFGTDNKFTTEHVLKRWSHVRKVLLEEGIHVVGESSDGDSRLLKAMRTETCFGLQKPDFSKIGINFDIPEFHVKFMPDLVCTQDTVHIGGKLRSRFVKPSLIMPMGNQFVSSGHLNVLINLVSKDKHLLNLSDLSPKDKMNFASVMKICDPRVWKLLEMNVPGSEGTIAYLRVMYYVLISYLCKTMTIADRIYYAWYSIFFLRLWRAWIKDQPHYSLTNNCITSNTYVCVELNAHTLLNLVFTCIRTNSFECFLPCQFGSQQCESFYRNLRPMTSTYSTVVNFTLLEAIHPIQRIQYQADISVENFEAKGETIFFPRTRHLNTNYEIQENRIPSPTASLLNNESRVLNYFDINKILSSAKKSAHDDISQLGMNIDVRQSEKVQIQNLKTNLIVHNDDDNVIQQSEDSEVEDDYLLSNDNVENSKNDLIDTETEGDMKVLLNLNGKIELPAQKKRKFDLKPNDECTIVADASGNEYVVKKSSICWLLNNQKTKLSSDRLERVKVSDYQKLSSLPRTSNSGYINFAVVCEEIFIGDWGLFKQIDGPKCLVGMVLGFGYMEGKTWKSIEYSSNFAKVTGNKKPIGLLCQWYNVDKNGKLLPINVSVHGYISIDAYKMTLPYPDKAHPNISFKENIFLDFKKEVSLVDMDTNRNRTKKSKKNKSAKK